MSSRGGRAVTDVFAKRRSLLAFWLGCAAVTGGVLTHVPMFLMGRNTHYVLAGMPMDPGMIIGMFAILAGIDRSYYGALERGEFNMTVDTLMTVATGLSVPAAEIWRRAGL